MKNYWKILPIVIILLLVLSFTSCEKDNDLLEDCQCGIIANDGIDDGCYWLEIRNDCSGNKKKFCFDTDIWMNNYVGDHFCVTNVEPW